MRLDEMINFLGNCGSADQGEATFLVARYDQLEDWCLAGPVELRELPASYDLRLVDLDRVAEFFQSFISGQESENECQSKSFVLVREQVANRVGVPKTVEDKDIWSVSQP